MKDDRREGIDIHEEAAILVGVILPSTVADEGDPLRELAALAEAAGVQVAGRLLQQRVRPRGRTYLGKGKVEELAAVCESARESSWHR